MGFILFMGFIALFFMIYLTFFAPRFKVGEYVYLKPTMQKCIIYDRVCRNYYLRDMKGNLMNYGFSYAEGMLVKVGDNELHN